MVDSQTIPAWLVAFCMVHAGLMWLITRKAKIRLDSRIFAVTLITQGLLYLVFQLFPINTEIRGFFVRLALVLLSLSQSVPLTISYFRSLKRGDE